MRFIPWTKKKDTPAKLEDYSTLSIGDHIEWRGHQGIVKSSPCVFVEFREGNGHYLEVKALKKIIHEGT